MTATSVNILRSAIALGGLLAVVLGGIDAAVASSPRGIRNTTQADGEALRAAASRGERAVVEAQLAAGVAVDAANDYGATPLILASMNGHAEVVRVLLDAGADPQRADTFYGRTPLQWASLSGSEEVASMLFVAGAGDFDSLFLEAVAGGEVDAVSRLLAIQVPSEEVLSQGLDRAIATRNEPLAQLLMSHGAVPPEPIIVSVDAATLRMYEGRYVDDAGYELVIIADQQTRTLLVRPPDVQTPLRFVPIEQATFVAESAPNIYVRFSVRDGRVVSMVFAQPGVSRQMTPR